MNRQQALKRGFLKRGNEANEFDRALEFLKQLPIFACLVREVSRAIQRYETDLSPKEG